MNNDRELNKNNIFYRPDLRKDENYESTSDFNSEYSINIKDDSQTIIKRTKDKINAINTLKDVVPSYIGDLINEPMKVIEGIISAMDDNAGEKIQKNTINIDSNSIVDVNISDGDKSDFPNDPFEDNIPDDIVINYTNNDPVAVIKKEYDYDLISIVNDYINDIHSIMNKASYDFISVLKDVGSVDILNMVDDYEINTADIPVDFKHLSDLVNRSKIGRDTRTRMYNKLFNADRTINHIRICKAAAMQRIRYYQANYTNEKDYNISVSNRILENSRYIYDNKYKENFIALYKYLHSSVIVMGECISAFINELQAKAILKKEVDR